MYYNNANASVDKELNDAVKRCISYNPETGVLFWIDKLSKYSPVTVGKEIGTPNKSGLHFTFFGRDLLCHRVAWFLYYGDWPETFIDHKNGCPEDNRLLNLRLADRKQNGANRKKTKNPKSSKYLGVCFAKHTGKWQAAIATPRRYLGQFSSETEAALAYNKAALEMYGEFAKLNEIEKVQEK